MAEGGRRWTSGSVTVLSLIGVWLCSGLDMVIAPLGNPLALLVIWLLVRSGRGGWSSLGIRRPESWPRTLAIAIGTAVVLEAAALFTLFSLLPRVGVEPPDLSRFRIIQDNLPVLLVYLMVSWTTAGFAEEVIWRGFSLGRLAALYGNTRFGWVLGLVLTSVLFGLGHAYQGPTGMVLTGVTGFVLGSVYLAVGRNLWTPIIAHGTIDTISFLLLYSFADRLM